MFTFFIFAKLCLDNTANINNATPDMKNLQNSMLGIDMPKLVILIPKYPTKLYNKPDIIAHIILLSTRA
jgi:hypothetical protein